jgi:hypothetical protein
MRADKPRREAGVRDMLLSLVVIFAFIALGWPAFVHQRQATVRVVDVQQPLAAARSQAGFPLVSPDGLAAGWRATSAYPVTGNAPGFHIGFLSPTGHFASVEQTNAATPAALHAFLGDASVPRDTATIAGAPWELRDVGKDQHALVRSSGIATVVVTGNAPWGELQALAASLH